MSQEGSVSEGGPAAEETASTPAATADRHRRLLLGGLAVLVVVGLALGAASLDEVHLSAAGGDAGYDQDQPVSPGSTERGSPGGDEPPVTMSPVYLLVIYVVMALSAVGFAWHKDVVTAWEALAVLATLLVFTMLVIGMDGTDLFAASEGGRVAEQPPDDARIGSGSGDQPNTAPPSSALPMGMLVMFGVVLALGAILGFSRSRSLESEEGDGEGADEAAATAAALGDAAGRAASRMADSDLENPVYRAWLDMRGALDEAEDPTLTPAQFRDRAIAAGLPPAAVTTLTGVFREVRYGHEDVTPEREAAARESLREIERAAADLAETAADAADTDETGSGDEPGEGDP